MATTAALQTFRRVFSDPSLLHRRSQMNDRLAYYNLLLAYYNNSVYDVLANWGSYKSTYRLYRQTRSIYNPTRRLVSFYQQHVYRGRLSIDALPFPDGADLAIPFADDSNPKLLGAIGQLWQWTNWLDGKDQMVGLAAMTGECMVEVLDEPDRGKVTLEIRWPGFVDTNFLELDAAGNVKQYALEFQSQDDKGDTFTYRKEVDQDEFRFFKDDNPFDYGQGTSLPNIYGFVPAAWVRHQTMDGVNGAPAVQGSINKLDELNSLASLIHDEIAKIVASPVLLTGTGSVSSLFNKPKVGPTDEQATPDAEREAWDILKGGPDAAMQKLPLSIADGIPYLEKLMGEIERDFPELAMYERLAQMTQVTGPGAERLMGNVAATLDRVAARHDQQSIKLFAMAVAIGGERIKRGDWRNLTRQQEKFRPFNLDSYERGDLDLEIKARRLFVPTSLEEAQEMAVRVGVAIQLDGLVDNLTQLKEAGYSEEEATQILDAKQAENAIAIDDAQQGMIDEANANPSPGPMRAPPIGDINVTIQPTSHNLTFNTDNPVTVNNALPDMPAPSVTVQMPEQVMQPPPAVNVTMPPTPAPVVIVNVPKAARESQTVQRDAQGRIIGSQTDIQYEDTKAPKK